MRCGQFPFSGKGWDHFVASSLPLPEAGSQDKFPGEQDWKRMADSNRGDSPPLHTMGLAFVNRLVSLTGTSIPGENDERK